MSVVGKLQHYRTPVLQGVLPAELARVPAEAIAGATLAAFAIPEVTGCTRIAGGPVVTGLYTFLVPMLLFSVLGSSRHLVIDTDSATAAILAGGLVGLARRPREFGLRSWHLGSPPSLRPLNTPVPCHGTVERGTEFQHAAFRRAEEAAAACPPRGPWMQADVNRKISDIVIVGAGFAGLEVAKALQRSPIRVTVIDRHNHTLFQPLLYQVATAALSESEVAVPIRSLLHGRNTIMLMDDVIGVDLARSLVRTASGRTVAYSQLVLATGSRYNYFGHEDWSRFAASPKTLQDALSIRDRLLLAFEKAEMCSDQAERQALMTFVIVGAGPTGVEMAGAIAELAKATLVNDFRHIDPAAARILLIEAGPAVLSTFPSELGRYAHQALERLGVQILLNTKIERIDEAGVEAGSRRIAARTVIWGAGVSATPVASWLGVKATRHGAIAVNQDFSVPGHPDVFVIGDAAEMLGDDGKPLAGLAAVAKQEGQYV